MYLKRLLGIGVAGGELAGELPEVYALVAITLRVDVSSDGAAMCCGRIVGTWCAPSISTIGRLELEEGAMLVVT
jgi:hypothetical protein